MRLRLRLSKWFIERQLRMNYRAALTGLLAARAEGDEVQIARMAARHARAAIYELAKERGEIH